MLVDVRVAKESDLEVVSTLFNQYRIWYHQHPDLTAAKNFVHERMLRNESTIFLAEIEGEPVGFTQLYPIFSSVRMQRAYLLNDLFVSEMARKKGVANALLRAAANYGKLHLAAFLMLQTNYDNLKAQSLYLKTGWRKIDDQIFELDL